MIKTPFCVVCGKYLHNRRTGTKYCKPACKQKAYRERKKMRYQINRPTKMTVPQFDNWLLGVNEEYGRDMFQWPAAIRKSLANIRLLTEHDGRERVALHLFQEK